MEITAEEIVREFGGRLEGDGGHVLTGAASLEEATSKDVTFLENLKYLSRALKTQAGCLICPPGTPVNGRTVIFNDHPKYAFAKVLERLEKEVRQCPSSIHSTAVVSPSARIKKNVSIGAFSVIEDDVEIGENSIIYPQCFIGRGTRIGSGSLLYAQVVVRESVTIGHSCVIHSNSVIGSDGYGYASIPRQVMADQEQEDKRIIHYKIPQLGTVELGDNVEIGSCVTVDRGTTGPTRIGSGTKVDNLVQIAHNVQIGENCLIVSQSGISGSTRLGNYVTLAGQVGLVGHITIGDGVIIAAQSGVMHDLESGSIVFGSPARPHKEAMKLQALLGKLPELYAKVRRIARQALN